MTVIGIITLLTIISAPAIRGLANHHSINSAAATVSRVFEEARVYALANRTYVRIGLGGTKSGGTIIVSIYSTDGTPADAASLAAKWPLLSQPLVLENFALNNNLNTSSPDTSEDELPMSSSIVPFTRNFPNLAEQAITFGCVIQFTPHGEVQLISGVPTRYIKMGFSQVKAGTGQRFIIRLLGGSGLISILYPEQGIQG